MNRIGRTKRTSLWRAAAVGLLAFVASVLPAHARVQESVAPTPAFREVTDEMGRTVRIPQPVRRIVSLAPSLTETVYALGLQDRLVGDTDYCDYPADAVKKHKVGGAVNPNFEEVAALKPDVVLLTKGLNRLETASALEQIGIPAYATADPHSVKEVIASLRRLADILGVQDSGNALGAEMEKQLEGLHEKLSGVTPKRVMFVVWTEPLISVGRKTFIADALEWAGATSVVDSKQDWPQFSLEEAARLQPEYLVFASNHSEAVRNDVETLAKKPGWAIMEAVRNRRVAVITDAVNRPGPRTVAAIEELARQLHPEVFVEKAPAEKSGAANSSATAKRPTELN